ncbi:hypothetical protein BC831DRAFT_501413 [Entophlyctis helioformis]|nr:hypothetical protein BC831DRAFT_501413 [Entophlyctis helioformis]
MANSTPLWTPSNPEDSNMDKFRGFVNTKYGLSLASYEDLRAFSVQDIERFWAAVWEFCNVKSSTPYTEIVDQTVPMDAIPKWFKGARLNYAENIVRHTGSNPAIFSTGEMGPSTSISFDELRDNVGRCSSALRQHGVSVGDRVVAYIPNCLEAVIFMLATASVGAIWCSASPDFGVVGVLDRFAQVEPKLLVSVNAVVYNGKVHDHLGKLREVVAGLPTLEKIVVVPFVPSYPIDITGMKRTVTYGDFLAKAISKELRFKQVTFDHPLVILFSSGTTGKPKCIVHSHGGVLLQHLKEHYIHGSLGPKDVYFYYTTTGWMMWNWLVGGLATGAAIVLYDGSPFKPTPNRLWELVDELGITAFGTSAKYIQSLMEGGIKPAENFKLTTLHSLYSTGSPLAPECYDYIYKSIKSDILVGSITGGTDIVSLFAGHNSALPVYRGEIQCRCLGMSIEAWDENRRPVLDEPGDLVCTKPFPVMPVAFWNDADGEKYRSAYFSKFDGVWYHGDFLIINSKTGGVIMLGRSDGTLNPSGVRFGSADLYNIVANFPEVADSLAVGQKRGDDERVADLVSRIKEKVRNLLSPRHVPAFILPIAEIPYTLTGKKVEVAVKRIISGDKVVPSSSLANPESLNLYYNIPELA